MATSRALALLASATLAAAGEINTVPEKNPPLTSAPPTERNPLSFFDGKLTFDFQERLRFEIRDNNFDFNDGANALTDDSWLLERTRIGIKFKPLEWFTFYAQGQDTREFFADRPNVIGQMGAEGDDAFDLRQGWLQFGADQGLSLKVGRQILLYGEERLIGPLDWANQSRTFDAAKFRYATDTWSLDLFTASVVRFEDGAFNKSDWIDSDATRDQFFSGLYFSTTAVPAHTLEAYALELHEEYAAGDTDFVTLGGRVKADAKKLGGWEYDAEAAAQAGDVRGRNLTAFAGHVGGGYNWLESGWKPRVYAEYNYATGDRNPGDGDVDTFQNLFPTNHPFYGYMDLFSWQNIHNPAVSLSIQPVKNLTAKLDYHLFWLANTGDAWYRANGVTQVRPVTPRADSFVGSELDFTVTWKAAKYLSFQAGYSHFFAGNYLEATGASADADFGYLMAAINF